jgi:hypothetical protein
MLQAGFKQWRWHAVILSRAHNNYRINGFFVLMRASPCE